MSCLFGAINSVRDEAISLCELEQRGRTHKADFIYIYMRMSVDKTVCNNFIVINRVCAAAAVD